MRIHRLPWYHGYTYEHDQLISASCMKSKDGLILANIFEVKKLNKNLKIFSPVFFFFDPCLLLFFPFESKNSKDMERALGKRKF